MHAISLAIVGTQFPNKKGPTRRFELELLKPGEPIELRPEPRNPADENAIAVYSCRGVQLGYLTAERAPLILSQMHRGAEVRAVFQAMTTAGSWIRATFDGSEPLVTPEGAMAAQPAAEQDDGFWPDPDYDD